MFKMLGSFVLVLVAVVALTVGIVYIVDVYMKKERNQFISQCEGSGGIIQRNLGPNGLYLNCINKVD